jgi:GT2 family glycosyltransferase
MEIIVVDNASSDGSAELVRQRFPQVRVVENKSNLGFAKANNIGVSLSKGNYLCFINSDVNVLDGCVTKLVDYLEAHSSVGMVGPSMLSPERKLGRSCRGFPTVWNMFCHAIGLDLMFPKVRLFGGYTLRYWPQNTTRPVEILGGWFWVVRREALDRVGLLDEDFFFYAEDMDWCRRFHANGLGVTFVSAAAAVHYGGGSSRVAPIPYYIQQQRAFLHYWKKHHSKLEQKLYFCECVLYHTMRFFGHLLLLPLPLHDDQSIKKVQLSWHSLIWVLSGAK